MYQDFTTGLIIGMLIGLIVGFVIVISQCEYNSAENKMWLRWSKPRIRNGGKHE